MPQAHGFPRTTGGKSQRPCRRGRHNAFSRFFFSSRRRHTISVSAFLLNRSSDLIAGIQSATSRQNTKDQVYAQNEMLAYQQKESTARVASIMENTNLSKQQQVSEIMRQMLTQAQTAGQYFTNDQIKE